MDYILNGDIRIEGRLENILTGVDNEMDHKLSIGQTDRRKLKELSRTMKKMDYGLNGIKTDRKR